MRVAAIFLFLFITSASQAQWAAQHEAEFMSSCVDPCAARSPNDQRCRTHCECMITQLKRVYPDYVTAEEGAKRNDPAILKTVGEFRDFCSKQNR